MNYVRLEKRDRRRRMQVRMSLSATHCGSRISLVGDLLGAVNRSSAAALSREVHHFNRITDLLPKHKLYTAIMPRAFTYCTIVPSYLTLLRSGSR